MYSQRNEEIQIALGPRQASRFKTPAAIVRGGVHIPVADSIMICCSLALNAVRAIECCTGIPGLIDGIILMKKDNAGDVRGGLYHIYSYTVPVTVTTPTEALRLTSSRVDENVSNFLDIIDFYHKRGTFSFLLLSAMTYQFFSMMGDSAHLSSMKGNHDRISCDDVANTCIPLRSVTPDLHSSSPAPISGVSPGVQSSNTVAYSIRKVLYSIGRGARRSTSEKNSFSFQNFLFVLGSTRTVFKGHVYRQYSISFCRS
jgi:hypothetical protein